MDQFQAIWNFGALSFFFWFPSSCAKFMMTFRQNTLQSYKATYINVYESKHEKRQKSNYALRRQNTRGATAVKCNLSMSRTHWHCSLPFPFMDSDISHPSLHWVYIRSMDLWFSYQMTIFSRLHHADIHQKPVLCVRDTWFTWHGWFIDSLQKS